MAEKGNAQCTVPHCMLWQTIRMNNSQRRCLLSYCGSSYTPLQLLHESTHPLWRVVCDVGFNDNLHDAFFLPFFSLCLLSQNNMKVWVTMCKGPKPTHNSRPQCTAMISHIGAVLIGKCAEKNPTKDWCLEKCCRFTLHLGTTIVSAYTPRSGVS